MKIEKVIDFCQRYGMLHLSFGACLCAEGNLGSDDGVTFIWCAIAVVDCLAWLAAMIILAVKESRARSKA
ncbi:MAG: hypothetical protein Q4B45_05950 [Coriobacteriia bacterium]|nr:hypothetical protein [Coriobacteriia bacterium]